MFDCISHTYYYINCLSTGRFQTFDNFPKTWAIHYRKPVLIVILFNRVKMFNTKELLFIGLSGFQVFKNGAPYVNSGDKLLKIYKKLLLKVNN